MHVQLSNLSKNDTKDVLGTFLGARGLDESYLNISEKDEAPFSEMRNMKEAVDLFIKKMESGAKVGVVVDCDCDGFTSAAAMIRYINNAFPDNECWYFLHSGKQHGISDKEFKLKPDTSLLIIPDAGSLDFKECNELIENGCDVIVLDHHELGGSDKNKAIIVSSQYDEYPNKELSGVGVTYKFLQALDDALWEHFADSVLDLVAVGNIADAMSMKSRETKYLVNKGLASIINPFIAEIVEKNSFNINEVTPTIKDIQFSVAPLINAMIRVGDSESKKKMFDAFLGNADKYGEMAYMKRGASEPVYENLYQHVARLCTNAKAQQKKSRESAATKMDLYVRNAGYDKNKIILCDATGRLEETLTGLTAQEMASKYQRPVMVFRNMGDPESGIVGGSARNNREDAVPDFMEYLQSTGLFIDVAGHPNSFGFKIKRENIPKLIEMSNKDLAHMDTQRGYIVDFDIDFEDLEQVFFRDVYGLRRLYGKDIEEPLVCIRNVPIEACDVNQLGKTGTSMKIKLRHEGFNALEAIKFSCNPDDEIYRTGTNPWKVDESWIVDIVGTVNMNTFRGLVTPQIMVKDYAVVK